MSPRLTRRALQMGNVAWGQFIVGAAALAGIRIYTELLGPGQYGVAMMLLGVILLGDSVGVMALNQTLLARCGLSSVSEERRLLSVRLSWRFFVRVGPLAAFAGLVAALVVVFIAGGDPTWFVLPLVLVLHVAAGTAKTSVQALFVLSRRYVIHSTWLASEAVITVVGVTLLLASWRADALAFLCGYVAAQGLCTLCFVRVAATGHFRGAMGGLSRRESQDALTYGRPVALMGPLGWISTYLDRYILGLVLGSSSTGLYVAVTGVVARPYGLTTSVLSNYFRPIYFQPGVRSAGGPAYSRILGAWVGSALCVGLVGAVSLALFGRWIAELALAPEFRNGATTLMVLFAVAQTFTIMTHAADNAVLAMGNSRRLLKTQSVMAAVTLVFIPVGVVLGGAVGGVLGRMVAEVCKLLAVMWLATSLIRRAAVATTSDDLSLKAEGG